jgi:hypothetical protein
MARPGPGWSSGRSDPRSLRWGAFVHPRGHGQHAQSSLAWGTQASQSFQPTSCDSPSAESRSFSQWTGSDSRFRPSTSISRVADATVVGRRPSSARIARGHFPARRSCRGRSHEKRDRPCARLRQSSSFDHHRRRLPWRALRNEVVELGLPASGSSLLRVGSRSCAGPP